MINIYKEELEVLLANYDKMLNNLLKNDGLVAILKKNNDELRKDFTLDYKTIHYQVKDKYSYKPKQQLSYNLLKLKRIFALWQKTNIVEIEGGIHYALFDEYKQFPKYKMQNPKIYPTEKTLNRLRVKALGLYVKENYVRDLRELRSALIMKFGLDQKTANFYVDIFKRMQAKKVLNNFSLVVDSEDIEDYNVDVFTNY